MKDQLVFPSYCSQERPALEKHPTVHLEYRFLGFLDDIYATLVVRLAHSDFFTLTDTWRLGKLLTLEVMARITSADQKCHEIPAPYDEGLDVLLEFTDDQGKGTGRRAWLQCKAGNSHLRRRKRDDAEVFKIPTQQNAEYWMRQTEPVLLVIGTLTEQREFGGRDKGFAEVRWMEIGARLQEEVRSKGKVPKQIVFHGERLDAVAVRRLRKRELQLP